MSDKFETRSFTEFRVNRDRAEPKIEGYAIVFNSLSENLGGFRERIAPVAVDRALLEDHDVRALIDHDSSLILGRSKAGTLLLWKDDHGLRVEINPPCTSYAKDLIEVIERGDVSGMSFGFVVPDGGDSWERSDDGTVVRTVTDMYLMDVSVVTYPAYPATDVAVRSLESFLAEEAKAKEVAEDVQVAAGDPEAYRDELLLLKQELIERE